MASMRHATLYLIFLCLLFHLTTATKYDSWADIPDCAVYCIKYWTITAQGSSCHAEDPMCYCTKSAWYFSMKNCLYNDSNSGCKTSQSTKNKDGILSYVDDIFCPTLNGTSSASTTSLSTTSSGARLAAAATSDSDEPVGAPMTIKTLPADPDQTTNSGFTVRFYTDSSSTSASSSSSSSVTTSSSSASASASSSCATSSSSTDESSTTPTSTTTISTSTSSSSSASSSSSSTDTSTSTPSSSSTLSYSVTTTVILVDPSGNMITSTPAPTSTTRGFVQDASTLQSTATSSDGAAPGANVLFYDGGMEGALAVSSMMALVMLVAGMVLLVN